MKLKVKFLKLSAGRPIAILHKNLAEKTSIHVNDRISVEKNGRKIAAVVDTALGLLKENEIVVSTEISSAMKLKEKDMVNIEVTSKPESLDLIYKKLACKQLNKKEFEKIMNDIVKNALTEAEVAYFVSAVYKCGMKMKEIADMTKAIVNSGKKLNLKGEIADKHCLPADTPILIRNDKEIKIKTIGDIVENIFAKNKDKIIEDREAYFLEGNYHNLNVLTWNEDYKVCFTPVTGLYKIKSPEEIFKINLKGNREISLTSKHTIFILKDGKVINIPASEVKKGDFVLVPSNSSEKTETEKINLKFGNPSRKDKKFNKEIEINKDFVHFIGYFLSEGFVNYQGIFLNFGSHEKNLIEDAKNSITKVFGIEPTLTKPHKTAVRLCIYSKELAKSFKNMFFCGENALNKKIPSFIFKLPVELKKEFIRATFRGDGYIRRGYEAVYVTVSKDLAVGLSYILSSLNISSSLSIRKEGERVFPQNKNRISKTHKAYVIYTQAREIFGGREKDNVAFINLLPIKELGEIEKEKIGWEFRKELKRQKYITKQKLLRIEKYIKSSEIKKILKSDISVLEIKNVEKTKSSSDYVYDLKTQEGRFIAGFMPICIHNSVGGIPGRTTPIIVSICSTTGLIIPKTSSRAITTPAGTADALEVICKVDFTISEIKKILKKTKACIVWGGSLNLAPADDKIIQVEKLLNLDPEAQLLASIIAKKLAASAKYVLIEIPYGKNAKVSKEEAKNLEKKFKKLAKYFKIKISCLLLKTEEPIGNGIGPALEIQDVIKVLKREDSCYKLEERALLSSGKLLELTGKARKGKGLEEAKKILDSLQAYRKFLAIVRAQKGNINGIKKAKYSKNIKSEKSGKIKEIKIKEINNLARILGCPADKAAGIYLHKHLNNRIKKREKILTLYSESLSELKNGINFYNKNKPFVIK